MQRRGTRAAYFVFQAVATVAWWLAIGVSPAWRRRFAFGDDGGSLLAFLPGDILFWMVGSLVAAWGEWTGGSGRTPLRHWLAGGVACSIVHATAAAALAGSGWAGVLLMLPAAVMTGWLAWSADR